MATPAYATPADKDDGNMTSEGSRLCTQCGLCCMGVLHQAAVLDEDEVEGARVIGLPVLDRKKPGFGLPCPFLVERSCSIYEQRPRVCSRYKCQLLQNVEAGKLGIDEALGTVATAHTTLKQAMAVIPEGISFAKATQMVRYETLSDSSGDALPPTEAHS